MSTPLTEEAAGLRPPEEAAGRLGGCVGPASGGRGKQAQGLPKKKPFILIYDSLKQKFIAFMMSLIHAFNDITVYDYVP